MKKLILNRTKRRYLLFFLTAITFILGFVLNAVFSNQLVVTFSYWMLLFIYIFEYKFSYVYISFIKDRVKPNSNHNNLSKRLFRPFEVYKLFEFTVIELLKPIVFLLIVISITLSNSSYLTVLANVLFSTSIVLFYVYVVLGFSIGAILVLKNISNKGKKEKVEKRIIKLENKRVSFRDYLNINRDNRTQKDIDDSVKKANKIIKLAYKKANLKPPQQIIWYDSPLPIYELYAFEFDSNHLPSRSSVWDCIWDWISSEFYGDLNLNPLNVKRSLSLENKLPSLVDSSTNFSFIPEQSLASTINNFCNNHIRDLLISRGTSIPYAYKPHHYLFYGANSSFLFYRYCIEILRLSEYASLKPLIEISKYCTCFLPGKNIVLVSRKPIKSSFDENGLVHNESSAAIVFADGTKIYAIHGYIVPKKVILTPQAQTIEEIRAEPNIETKRIRIERLGWTIFLEKINALVIDSKLIKCSENSSWLESLYFSVEDNICALATYDPSTGKPYILEVDPNCRTCEDAQQYLLSAEDIMSETGFDFTLDCYPKLRT